MAHLPAIYRLFDDLFSGQELPLMGSRFNPPVEIEETDSHYILSFDLPGMRKEDVQVQVQEGILTLRAERKDQRMSQSGQSQKSQRRSEKFYGMIERSISLPSGIQSENVEAQLENGVLHIAIPKADAAQPKLISVGEGKGGFLSKWKGKAA